MVSEDLLQRILAEYREMPGMRLTKGQAQRLWNLDSSSCEAALNALVDAKMLSRVTVGRSTVFQFPS